MESTPVAGVEIKKLTLAPLLAPSLRSAIEVGITPQLQIGSGMPNKADQSTDLKFGFEILGTYKWFGTHTCRIPASKKPSNRNGAISENSVMNCQTNFSRISTTADILLTLLVQNMRETCIENKTDMLVVKRIEHLATFATRLYQIRRTQNAQLVTDH